VAAQRSAAGNGYRSREQVRCVVESRRESCSRRVTDAVAQHSCSAGLKTMIRDMLAENEKLKAQVGPPVHLSIHDLSDLALGKVAD